MDKEHNNKKWDSDMNETDFNGVAEPQKKGSFLETIKELWDYSTKGIHPDFKEHRNDEIASCFQYAFQSTKSDDPAELEEAIKKVIKMNKDFGNKWGNRDKITMFSWGDFNVKDVLDYQRNMTPEEEQAALDARTAYQVEKGIPLNL
jgi:hypothetical protein